MHWPLIHTSGATGNSRPTITTILWFGTPGGIVWFAWRSGNLNRPTSIQRRPIGTSQPTWRGMGAGRVTDGSGLAWIAVLGPDPPPVRAEGLIAVADPVGDLVPFVTLANFFHAFLDLLAPWA